MIEISLPPLRKRKEDIAALARHFVQRFNDDNGKRIEGISDDALELLMQYDWPGNVRELENQIERAVVVSRRPMLDVADFPPKFERGGPRRGGEDLLVGLTVREVERRLIMGTLEAFGGNRTDASAQLGISTRTLRNKLHEYGAMDAFKEGGKPAVAADENGHSEPLSALSRS